jgi:hypothetical protein
MGNNRSLTQAEFNTQMAKIAPQLYRPSTPDEVATAARPIKGMRFAVDQPVRDKRSGRTGKVDYCTAHTNGSRKYVITWDEGSEYGGRDKRTWVWEVDLREIERPESVIEAERIRANGQAGDPPSSDDAPQRPDQAASPASRVRRVYDPELGNLVAEIRVVPK